MPEHHHKEENEISALIESPETFIKLVIKNKEDRDWALNEILHGGPHHKQVYSALLLQRIYALVQLIEKQTAKKFTVQKGITLTSHKDETEIPVPLVLPTIKKQDQEDVAEVLSHAPAHEIIAFNSLLQAIEWNIASLSKSNI